jgi:hypothetical protein
LHLVHLGGAVTGWVSRLGGVVIAKDGDNQHANGKSAFDRTPEGRH